MTHGMILVGSVERPGFVTDARWKRKKPKRKKMAIEKRFEHTESIFTDKIDAVGTVRRVFFRCLHVFGNYDTVSGLRSPESVYEWHYFGTTPAEKPKEYHPEAPVIQNTYISFPVDFELLGPEANEWYYQMGVVAGLKKEGLT